MWHCYSFKAESFSTLVPLIKLEQKQNYIHWFRLNEKDFRVTGEDKSSFLVLPKIPTPRLFWETQRGLILCLSCCQMRVAILHFYLFPTALSNFSQGRLMACSVSDNLKLRGGSLYGIRRDYEFYVLRKWTVCPNAMSQPLWCSLLNCGFSQTVYSFSTHRKACLQNKITEPSEDTI